MSINAKSIFDAILAGGCTEIERMIQEQEQEDLFLDFKQKTPPKDQNKDKLAWTVFKEDKENYAQALSGFANSAGGVLIWGVAEEKDATGRRIGRRPDPIDSVAEFITALNRMTNQLVVPAVNGVVTEAVPVPNGDGKGYAVTFIPESAKTPHQAQAGLLQYFKRYTDEFKRMYHYELEDMFGRRQRPDLSAEWSYKRTGDEGNRRTYMLILWITNEGRAVAQHFGVDLEFPAIAKPHRSEAVAIPGGSTLRSTSVHGAFIEVVKDSDPNLIRFRNPTSDPPIFPDEAIEVCPNRVLGHWVTFSVNDEIEDRCSGMRLKYRIYCENAPMKKGNVPFKELHDF